MKKLVLFLMFFTMFSLQKSGAQYQPLYKKIPNQNAIANQESEAMNNGILIVSKVSEPAYRYFRVKEDTVKRPCVIICPGGGYAVLAAGHEGTDVAKYLNAIGVNALVLKYRIPNDAGQPDKTIAPLQDVQQAIYLARTHAAEWGIDPHKTGVLGFSAGGHLAASLATHYADVKIQVEKNISLRPDFQVLIYPVISFRAFGHHGSAENLLGKTPAEAALHYFSNEENINAQSPPAFLVHAKDDNVVPVENAIRYQQALQQNNVPALLMLQEKGGHGFGMNNPREKDQWPPLLADWLKKSGIL